MKTRKHKMNKEKYTSIMNAVSRVFEIDANDIFCKSRLRKYVEPRHLALYMMDDMKVFGNRCALARAVGIHHATVRHAVLNVDAMNEVDKHFRKKVNAVFSQLEEEKNAMIKIAESVPQY